MDKNWWTRPFDHVDSAIISVWSKQYWYDLGGNDDTPISFTIITDWFDLLVSEIYSILHSAYDNKVPPLPCIFYCVPYGDLFCGLNSTSVDKPVLINVKIECPHHKTHVLTIKIHDLTITTHGPITVYSDL